MADIGENIRTTVVASTAMLAAFSGIAAPNACTQDVIAENAPLPRIWYGLANSNEDVDYDGNGGLADSEWDIEIISDSQTETQTITAALKRFLNGKRGAFGTQTVLGCFVTDHDDDYVPQNLGSEDGYSVAAIRARILYATT